MKRYIVILLVVFLASGCGKKEEKVIKIKPTPTPISTREPLHCDKENTVPVAFYQKENGVRKKVTSYQHSFVLNEDLAVFTTFLTEEAELSGNSIMDVFPLYYQKYQEQNYKIGYFIKFTLENGTIIQKTILNPTDAESVYNYMQIYLYDDIHQTKGKWYSHIVNMEENTLLTTIKLTGSTYTNQIASPITLTTFLYQNEKDFDSNMKYQGCYFYDVTIERS
ncbi:MAG: hypothetical protein PHN72_03780 [Bacilli bacterium]|nr:hypothetical protein [Bacilli bacterium]